MRAHRSSEPRKDVVKDWAFFLDCWISGDVSMSVKVLKEA